MPLTQPLSHIIQHRADTLTISLSEAQTLILSNEQQDDVASVSQSDNRQLLRVEKQAVRDKELNKRSEQTFVNSIRDMVEEAISQRIAEALGDQEHIFTKILNYDANLSPLLDALSVRASSISKIEPLAASMPWLYDDMMRMVNMPKYRRTDAKGKAITVDTLRVALGFFGIENLKMVVPSLAFRRWIPQITDPYPEIKSRIWEFALGTAISSKKIAEHNKVDGGHAFTLGLFHNIGHIVLMRLYFRIFDQVQQEALIEAHNDKKREEHAALSKIQPSCAFLVSLIEKYGNPLTLALIRRMGFERVFIANAMEEFAKKISFKDMSPLAQTLTQARAYTNYRVLKNHRLISMDEAKSYLRHFRFPDGSLAALKSIDLKHLNLKMEES
ncbi:HDOD domain-containing protein [Aestuariibacter sp. AA17]|uniref:HDOD domain-containing protein n=1 Tax=Fluctibacter corallii TaxID=2984329 RepID=A0ABT3A727_9ALTE|nr:HDOD domain-containing protein [Aestuariibacter sp. AA17]MCV2884364.1 HDOD domain-containing protein [Aestuariibacter sp. AA17]